MKKTLDLNSYGLAEMNVGELEEINGGFFGLLLAAAVVVVAVCAIAYNAGADYAKSGH
jgi:hypothetical protein